MRAMETTPAASLDMDKEQDIARPMRAVKDSFDHALKIVEWRIRKVSLNGRSRKLLTHSQVGEELGKNENVCIPLKVKNMVSTTIF